MNRLPFAGVNLAALPNVVTKLSPEALVILCDKTNRLGLRLSLEPRGGGQRRGGDSGGILKQPNR